MEVTRSGSRRRATVVGAVHCGDYMVICADSQITQNSVRVPQDKLQRRLDPPLAWAYAGDEDIGRDFSRWLTRVPVPRSVDTSDAWDRFSASARDELVRLNHERLARGMAASKEFAFIPTDVLLAGYINGDGRILELNGNGGRYFVEDAEGSAFIGPGAVHATVAHRVFLRHLSNRWRSPQRVFEAAMKEAAELAEMCSPPIQTLIVTSTRIETKSED